LTGDRGYSHRGLGWVWLKWFGYWMFWCSIATPGPHNIN